MRPHIGAKKLVATGGVLAVGLTSAVLVTSGAAQASSSYGYSGYAHGTYVYVPAADSGPQVTSLVSCTRRAGLHDENTAATAQASGDTIAHSVKTTTDTHNDGRGDGTTSTGTADDIKLGNIELEGAETFARAVSKNGVFETTAGTKFAAVKINGVKVPALTNPAPNTKVGVPGLGYIVFNRQVFTETGQSATASASAVLIHADMPNPWVEKGSTVAVLLTKAEVGGATVGMLTGKTYLTQAHVGDLVKSNPTSLQTTCAGTDGKTVEVDIAGATLPKLGHVGAGKTYKSGVIGAAPSGWMKAETSGVNLGDGKVETGAVSAKAMASKIGGKVTTSWTTEITSVVIDGQVVPVPKGPNQTMDVPGLGTITFNKVKQGKNGVSITAMEVYVKALNTTVEIAHAEAGVGS